MHRSHKKRLALVGHLDTKHPGTSFGDATGAPSTQPESRTPHLLVQIRSLGVVEICGKNHGGRSPRPSQSEGRGRSIWKGPIQFVSLLTSFSLLLLSYIYIYIIVYIYMLFF